MPDTEPYKAMVYKTPERVDRPLPMRPDPVRVVGRSDRPGESADHVPPQPEAGYRPGSQNPDLGTGHPTPLPSFQPPRPDRLPDRRPDGPHDPVRHAAYLRVSALRNAVEHYDGRTGVSADDVVTAAELFHDFLTRKDTP